MKHLADFVTRAYITNGAEIDTSKLIYKIKGNGL